MCVCCVQAHMYVNVYMLCGCARMCLCQHARASTAYVSVWPSLGGKASGLIKHVTTDAAPQDVIGRDESLC